MVLPAPNRCSSPSRMGPVPVTCLCLMVACFSDSEVVGDADDSPTTGASTSNGDASDNTSGAHDGSTTSSVDGTATGTSADETTTGQTSTSDSDGTSDESTGEPDACAGGPFSFSWFGTEAIAIPGSVYGIDGGYLDGDPHFDLVVADYNEQQVRVYLGNGDGSFSIGTVVHNVGRPSAVRVAAIADSTPDLFIQYYDLNSFERRLVRWRGDGTGGFQFASPPMAPVDSFDLGYVNADNRLDIVSSVNNPSALFLRTSDASENYGPPVEIAGDVGGGVGVLLHDLDADGDDDLIVTSATSARVLLNHNTNFAEVDTFVLQPPMGAWAIGDADGDGRPDLVTGSLGGGNTVLQIYPGGGDGSFGAPHTHAISNYTSEVRVVDVDSDGVADLVAAFGDTLTFLHSNGDGTFESQVITTLAGCLNVRGLVLEDLNGDCVLDAIVGCSGLDDEVRVYLSAI